MVAEEEPHAVTVRNAWKRYTPKVVILKGLNMTVGEGSIYGLLGPSGCGKTSLLSCIVGVRRLDFGTIDLSVSRRIEVGFMPQDITLHKEFTLSEVFNFYGAIYGLSKDDIKRRGQQYITLLEIPNDDRFIGNCSGGQQRRISLAVTLLHDPKLLILDEPTVGVDPVLCANIWEHFVYLVRELKKTIIITTHYIEEAKNANRIGLMRGGVLLAEEPPVGLMLRYNADSLEDVFLKLSSKQTLVEGSGSADFFPPRKPNQPTLRKEAIFKTNRFKAQMIKNINWTKRNLPVTLFVICLPAFLLFLMNHLNDVKNYDLPVSIKKPIAIVNDEVDDCQAERPRLMKLLKNCKPTKPFSCRYVDYVQRSLNTLNFDTEEAAVEAVKRSRSHGVLYFPKNFSQHMMSRVKEQTDASASALDGSVISVRLDMSEFSKTVVIVQKLSTLVIDLIQDICEECGYQRNMASIPITIEEKIYALSDVLYTFVPAYFGSVAFYTTTMFTSSSIVMERASGIFERTKIAGLTMFEIIVAHIVIQVIVMTLQNALSFTVLYGIFDNPMRGSMTLAWLIVSINELNGMVFGFFLSVIIRAEANITYACIGTVLTLFMLTGVIWPVEGIHPLLQLSSSLLPVTYSSDAFKNVAIRGFGITRLAVIEGLIAPILAMLGLIALSLLAVKLKLGSFD